MTLHQILSRLITPGVRRVRMPEIRLHPWRFAPPRGSIAPRKRHTRRFVPRRRRHGTIATQYCTACLQADETPAIGTERCRTADMITGASRRDHITPILQQLRCLPVQRRVDFKIAVLVFQCLTGQVPGYLAEECQLVADVSVL